LESKKYKQIQNMSKKINTSILAVSALLVIAFAPSSPIVFAEKKCATGKHFTSVVVVVATMQTNGSEPKPIMTKEVCINQEDYVVRTDSNAKPEVGQITIQKDDSESLSSNENSDSTDSIRKGWDGSVKGGIVESEQTDSTKKNYVGHVTLIKQREVNPNNIYTGPCKPPYLCFNGQVVSPEPSNPEPEGFSWGAHQSGHSRNAIKTKGTGASGKVSVQDLSITKRQVMKFGQVGQGSSNNFDSNDWSWGASNPTASKKIPDIKKILKLNYAGPNSTRYVKYVYTKPLVKSDASSTNPIIVK
jgi:hypothetical protein